VQTSTFSLNWYFKKKQKRKIVPVAAVNHAGGIDVQLHSLFSSSKVGGVWSDLLSSRIIPQK
jgi:hypothetical protein